MTAHAPGSPLRSVNSPSARSHVDARRHCEWHRLAGPDGGRRALRRRRRSPVTIGAATGTGMGTYLFAATTLTLALPADVYADAYASTITISVVSAP